MIQHAKEAEEAAVLRTAQTMCAAARTAPKTRGIDHIETCIVTGDDQKALADEMVRLSEPFGYPFFRRDAQNVLDSAAIVLIGVQYGTRGMNEGCGWCNFKNCGECIEKGGACAFDPMDLGIAIGAAASIAADARIDSRVMFSVGRAAISLGIFAKDVKSVIGIPLSVTGKSPYFDRKG